MDFNKLRKVMKTGNVHIVRIGKAPVVEIDTEARSAYVRFSSNPVYSTKEVEDNNCIVTMDFDKKGHVVGVELIGVQKFGIRFLLKHVPITVSDPDRLTEADYVSASVNRCNSHSLVTA